MHGLPVCRFSSLFLAAEFLIYLSFDTSLVFDVMINLWQEFDRGKTLW